MLRFNSAGDSGGPILDNGVQVGVVSFGIGCARASHNGVYSRVSSVTEWIADMICEMSDEPPASCPAKTTATGPGKLTLHIKYDNFAKEVAYTFQQVKNGKVHLFQPYNSDAK